MFIFCLNKKYPTNNEKITFTFIIICVYPIFGDFLKAKFIIKLLKINNIEKNNINKPIL